MMNVTCKCSISLVVVLAIVAVGQAGTMDFSDLDPGLPLNQQGDMPVNYSTGLPAGITATWTNFMWKNADWPDDPTLYNDDQMQAFLTESSGSIDFSSPLYVGEIWMLRTSWGDTGDWTVKGMLGGVEQWSGPVTAYDTWISVQDGAGIAVDRLEFPGQRLWNHIDQLTFNAVPEPTALALLASGVLALLVWRRRGS